MKWLNHLRVSATESDSFWVATAYRYPVRRVGPGAAVEAKDMVPLTGLVVKSLITTPLEGAVVSSGPLAVAGFAWAGEADIAGVDISVDHRRDLAAGKAGRRAAALHLAPLRIRLHARTAGLVLDPLARHRYERRRPAGRVALESIRISLEPGTDSVRVEVK